MRGDNKWDSAKRGRSIKLRGEWRERNEAFARKEDERRKMAALPEKQEKERAHNLLRLFSYNEDSACMEKSFSDIGFDNHANLLKPLNIALKRQPISVEPLHEGATIDGIRLIETIENNACYKLQISPKRFMDLCDQSAWKMNCSQQLPEAQTLQWKERMRQWKDEPGNSR